MESFLNNNPIVTQNSINIESNIISLEGTKNTRNLNYLRSKNNKIVKLNTIYRSDNLDNLSYEDVNKLKDELNINILIDLRNEKEIKNNKFYKLFNNYKNFSTNLDELLQTELLLGLLEDEDEEIEEEEDDNFLMELQNIYKKVHGTFLDICSEQISLTLKTVINAKGNPLLIFSNFGKDRTGVIIAIILLLLEVDLEDIIEDYMFSNNYFKSVLDENVDENNIIFALDKIKNQIPNNDLNILNNENYLKEDINDIKSVLLASKENLKSIEETINQEYNSIENYALNKLELTKKDIDDLKKYYLQDYKAPESKYMIN